MSEPVLILKVVVSKFPDDALRYDLVDVAAFNSFDVMFVTAGWKWLYKNDLNSRKVYSCQCLKILEK